MSPVALNVNPFAAVIDDVSVVLRLPVERFTLLPLTEDPKLSWKYGTRHRAAIGMTEGTDAACLVVSEETGDVSVAIDGSLKKYEDLVTLKSDLENILGYKDKSEDDKKTIFKINNFMTIKKSAKDESGKV